MPNNHSVIPIHNIKKIIGSNVLITPSCIHLFDIGLSACVPYELKISTKTCKKTAN